MTFELKDSRVEPVTVKFATDYITRYNYTGSMTGWSRYCFGHFFGDVCGGVNVFGVPTGQYTKRFPGQTVLQLYRGVSLPRTPFNSGSFLTSHALAWLKKNSDVDVVVAFCNPKDGEFGTIYQSSNWSYLGLTGKAPVFLIDGRRVHRRVLIDRHGTANLDALRAIFGDRMRVAISDGKFRYAYGLREKIPSLPYPKRTLVP